MKSKLLFFFIFLITFYGFSQGGSTTDDLRSRFRPGIMWFYSGLKPSEEGKPNKYDRLIIDLAYNDWQGDIQPFNSPASSIGVNVSFLFDIIFNKANTLGMGVGLGYSFYNNTSKYGYLRDYEEKITLLYPLNSSPMMKYQRTSFNGHYFEIPVEFRFRTKGIQHFKLMVGGKLGINLSSLYRYAYKIGDEKNVIQGIGFPDTNLLRYGLTMRVGIRNWAFYGAYYFSPLFKNSESTKLYPFELGLSISLF